ncbi:hypothetical protein NUM3379_33430 [Kineococcus sp. NUM-3379]
MLARLPAVELLTGRDGAGAPVTVAVLSPAASADPAARRALVHAAGGGGVPVPPGLPRLCAADLHTFRPWVASYLPPEDPSWQALVASLPAGPSAAAVPGAVPGGGRGAQPWAPGPRSRRGPATATIVAVVAAAVAGLALLAGGGLVLVSAVREQLAAAGSPADPFPPQRPAPPDAAPPDPAPSDPAAPGPGAVPWPGPAGEPELREQPVRTLVGPSYEEGEETWTMAFEGFPFAFRTPASWGCVATDQTAAPDARGWVCIDEQNPGDRQRVNIRLRPCPAPCGPGERRDLDEAWFDEPADAHPADERTTWDEDPPVRQEGDYALDVSRYFGDAPGGPPRWQLGVYVSSPPQTREEVQKVLNDIVTQTP